MPRPAPFSSTAADRGPPVEALAGLVERVTFHNAETGFCVLRVKARGQRELVTIVGHAATIASGEWVQMSGTWINDRTHGLQFKAAFLKASPPTTLEGIEKYLGSGMIHGIGPIYARMLVQAFGAAVFELIEQEPTRLREVTGIGPKRAARIIAGWAEQKVIREIMLFLHANGVGTSRAVRIYKTYGADAVQVITENPYRLARDIRGIGFRTADLVARKLGIEPTAMIRVRAGISFALAEASGEGHCGLPVDELTTLAGTLLDVPAELIETALVLELEAGKVVADTLDGRRCVFLAGLYRAEQVIAERLRCLARGTPPWPWIDAGKAIPWVEGRTELVLAESQKAALRLALQSKVLVITGGPGVGKSTSGDASKPSRRRPARYLMSSTALVPPAGHRHNRLTSMLMRWSTAAETQMAAPSHNTTSISGHRGHRRGTWETQNLTLQPATVVPGTQG